MLLGPGRDGGLDPSHEVTRNVHYELGSFRPTKSQDQVGPAAIDPEKGVAPSPTSSTAAAPVPSC